MQPELTQAGRALKTATHALIQMLGGLEASASACRVGITALSDYQNPHRPGVWMPLDVIAALEAVAHAQPVTEALARLQGRHLEEVAASSAPARLDHAGALLAVTSGQVLAEVIEALQDGHVDASERDSLLARLGRARDAVDAVERALAVSR